MAFPRPARMADPRVTILLAVALAVGARLSVSPADGDGAAEAGPPLLSPAGLRAEGAGPHAPAPGGARAAAPAQVPDPAPAGSGPLWPIAPASALYREEPPSPSGGAS